MGNRAWFDKIDKNCARTFLAIATGIASLFPAAASAQDAVVVPNPISQTDDQPSPSDAGRPQDTVASDTAQPTETSAAETTAKATSANSTNEPAAPNEAQSKKKDDSDNKPVVASAKDPFARDLQNIVQRARQELNQATLPKVEIAKRQLIEAIDNLDRYLNTNPSSRSNWINFLQLNEMRAEAEKETPNAGKLNDFEMTMRQNYLGFEYRPFMQVREALLNYRLALRWGASPEQSIKLLDTRLEKFIETLNEPTSEADRNEAVSVVALYLQQSGQAQSSLAALRSRFAQPNIQAYVKDTLLTRTLMRPVGQPSPVNECLLGTHVVGNAYLNGAVSADLLPSPNGIALNLFMNANLSTNSTGYNRGVVLRSTGNSPVQASKQIFVSPNGISSTPASVATNLSTQINAIEHRSRIVRRIARRRASEQQPQANMIAEGRMQNRIRTQFDQQVESQLNQSRVQLASFQQRAQSRPELARIGLPQPQYSYNSSTNAVHAILTHRTPSQLAASRPSTIPRHSDALIFIDAHESLFMNSIDVFLSGRTIKNSDLDDLVKQFGGEVTPELKEEADGEPWSITFAGIQPVLLEFNDGLVKITLRILRMTRGTQGVGQSVVAATYRPSFHQGVLRLDREGELDISFGNMGGLAAVSLKPFLRGKFEKTFKPVLVNRSIVLPRPANPNVPPLQIGQVQLDDGWLQVSLR